MLIFKAFNCCWIRESDQVWGLYLVVPLIIAVRAGLRIVQSCRASVEVIGLVGIIMMHVIFMFLNCCCFVKFPLWIFQMFLGSYLGLYLGIYLTFACVFFLPSIGRSCEENELVLESPFFVCVIVSPSGLAYFPWITSWIIYPAS